MGFKSMPWEMYYKPSLDEWVIRQKHTVHTSGAIKIINGAVRDNPPARKVHDALKEYGVPKIKYENGTRVLDYAVPIRIFKAGLRTEMLQTVPIVDQGVPLPSRQKGRAEMTPAGMAFI